jgi:hypothetical protein
MPPEELTTVTTAVSDEEQPLLLVAVSVGIKTPTPLYAFVGFMVVDVVASPKLQEYEDKVLLDTVKATGSPANVGFGVNDAMSIEGVA